jgi:hypothetical protein
VFKKTLSRVVSVVPTFLERKAETDRILSLSKEKRISEGFPKRKVQVQLATQLGAGFLGYFFACTKK